MNKISTSALSKLLQKPSKEIFDKLRSERLISKEGDSWSLTKQGYEFGGEMIESKKFGRFIAWPEQLNPFNLSASNNIELLGVSYLSADLKISAQRLNLILAEIGWIEKSINGWSTTELGGKTGGVTAIHSSGNTYVLWPKSILSYQTCLIQ